jgi:hypothetical protein
MLAYVLLDCLYIVESRPQTIDLDPDKSIGLPTYCPM